MLNIYTVILDTSLNFSLFFAMPRTHIEIQAGKEANFAQRMYRYYYRISERYNLPIASFAILCDANSQWRPTRYEQTSPGTSLIFQFTTVKLLDYQNQWQQLERSNNPFATVVMAQLKLLETKRRQQERKQWKFWLMRRLYERGYQQQDILNLFRFIDWLMILPESLDQLFWEEVEAYEQERRMPYITSVERIGIQKGLEQGSQREAVRFLVLQLRHRFSEIPDALELRLQQLTVQQLEQLAPAILTASSVAEFEAQMPESEPASIAQIQPIKPSKAKSKSKNK